MDYVPSIYDFGEILPIEPTKAMNCARISKLRNILHLNKLYVILQALESMNQTNFTFKDIGVFYTDEDNVRKALKWYYCSGAITSLGSQTKLIVALKISQKDISTSRTRKSTTRSS